MGPVDVEVYRVIAEGDLVARTLALQDIQHGRRRIWRFNDDGKVIEHWDVLQQVPETNASGNDMFSQLS